MNSGSDLTKPAPDARVNILGISAFYHDSAACLVQDGQIVAAAQEERFTRKKHDAGFPKCAVSYCLREGGVTIQDLDYVAFYEKPFLKFDRLLHSYLAYAPAGGAFTMDLSAMPNSRRLAVEWFNPAAGATITGDSIAAGSSSQTFSPPFSGDAVLFLVDTAGHR